MGTTVGDTEPLGDWRVYDALWMEFVLGEHNNGSANGSMANALGPAKEHGVCDGDIASRVGGERLGAKGGGGVGIDRGGSGEKIDGVGGWGRDKNECNEGGGSCATVDRRWWRFSQRVGGFC